MKSVFVLIMFGFSAAAAAQTAVIRPALREVDRDPAEKAQPASNPASWVRSQDYPRWATRAGTTGRVVTELTVEATGRVSDCRIIVSSKVPELDRIACEKLIDRGMFKPARDAKGIPVASVYEQSVRFALPARPNAPEERRFVLEFTIGEDGAVSDCTADGYPEDMTSNPCAKAPVYAPALSEEGTPEKRRYRITNTVERLPLEGDE